MVLVTAGIFTKTGKRLIGRCFVDDVTRARLEGLLDAFPKLIVNDKSSSQRQHTFIETDSVRYVFHPLDNIYVVLVTTKNSNILEDLETLRLFSRVVPEYCRNIDEKEILANCFNLIHAFDEIVTLGYRESVNLAQIRTFTEMDSHEERVFMQIKEAQEKAAKDAMAEKAKELKRQQREALTRGLKTGGTSFSSASAISSSSTPLTAVQEPTTVSKPAPLRGIGSGKAMKLGAKTHNEDEFLSQLAKEGQSIAPIDRTPRDTGKSVAAAVAPVSNVKKEPVHIKCEEKFMASVSRDGALQSGELFGSATLLVSSQEFVTVAVQMKNNAPEGVSFQTHPHLEKKDWSNSLIKLKSATKPFPVNNAVGVLKWRMTLAGEEQLPLALNCWPQENPDGCQVNIEYTLQREDLTLENVVIIIPLPPSTSPVVSECEGSYDYVRSRNQIVWTLPVIDSSNSTGTLEFTVPNGHSDHFFPVQVKFHSENLYAQLSVQGAQMMDSGAPVAYSVESSLLTDKYEVV